MHYAEFAEDEVSSLTFFFFSFFIAWKQYSKWLGIVSSFTRSDQRVRGEQVEGNWTEGWEASKGTPGLCGSMKPRHKF